MLDFGKMKAEEIQIQIQTQTQVQVQVQNKYKRQLKCKYEFKHKTSPEGAQDFNIGRSPMNRTETMLSPVGA